AVDCFGRISPFVGVGASGTCSLRGASVFGAGTLIATCGCGVFIWGVGALGNSFFGCSTGASGCGTGGSIVGATFFNTLGSTLTTACGAGGAIGFKASNAPGGSKTVICRRAISSSSLVLMCGPKSCGS